MRWMDRCLSSRLLVLAHLVTSSVVHGLLEWSFGAVGGRRLVFVAEDGILWVTWLVGIKLIILTLGIQLLDVAKLLQIASAILLAFLEGWILRIARYRIALFAFVIPTFSSWRISRGKSCWALTFDWSHCHLRWFVFRIYRFLFRLRVNILLSLWIPWRVCLVLIHLPLLTLFSALTKISLLCALSNHFTINFHCLLQLDNFLSISLFLWLLLRFKMLLKTLFLQRDHFLHLYLLLSIFTLNLRHLGILRVQTGIPLRQISCCFGLLAHNLRLLSEDERLLRCLGLYHYLTWIWRGNWLSFFHDGVVFV